MVYWRSVTSKVSFRSAKEFTWLGELVFYHPWEESQALAWLRTHC